ncbi:MAG: 3-phosphoshikimate 1-carboxyvinyltransferase, partial [Planctomycetota bacterium]
MADAVRIVPLDRPPDCCWMVPGSKSITNRSLILAALSPGETLLTGALLSEDTRYMIGALRALGIGVENRAPDRILVDGGRERLQPPSQALFIGNSGTSVRFLAALACLVPGTVELVGDTHMQRPPIADLV